MEDLHPIKYHTLLDDLQNIQSPMHTLVVVKDIEVAEQVAQFLDEHGIVYQGIIMTLITVTKQVLSHSNLVRYQS